MPSLDLEQRHQSVREAARWLVPNKNLPLPLAQVSELFHALMRDLLSQIEDDPQLTMALHKLTEAKDCAVRARLASM